VAVLDDALVSVLVGVAAALASALVFYSKVSMNEQGCGASELT